jgi:predicted acyl esterase
VTNLRALAAAMCAALVIGAVPAAPSTHAAAARAPGQATLAESARGTKGDQVAIAHGRQTWKTFEAVVPTITGPNDDIAVGIDTRLYVPDNASAKRPRPAILMTHGFGLTKDSTEVLTTARFFAAHGYHVLTYTSSGFGGSGGCVTLQSADYDIKSASQLIDTLLEPRTDVLRRGGRLVVGTIGGSYGGGGQLTLAAFDKRIRASVVGRTWHALQYSLDPNNYISPGDRAGLKPLADVQGVFKQEWTSLFYALGNSGPAQGGGSCPETKGASGDPVEIANAGSCPGFYSAVCDVYQSLSSTGDASAGQRAFIGRASAATFLKRVRAATLLVQGQRDTLFNLNDAAATYRALKRQGTPVGMIWNWGGHGGYTSQPGECEAYDGIDRTVKEMDRCYLPLRALGWMNHFLRGKKSGRGPAFAYHRDWKQYSGKGPNDEQYGVSDRFPLRRSRTNFFLSGSGDLVTDVPAVETGTVDFLNPSGGQPAAYTERSNFTGPGASPSSQDVPPMEQPGQFAAFTSAPFKRRFNAVGIPKASLLITNTNAQDMVFFAKVYDVAPDGTETLIRRLISPVRVPAAAVGEPVRMRLAGFAHRFGKGHRVRLVLATTDTTSYNAKVADVLTVTASGSVLTLPGRLR